MSQSDGHDRKSEPKGLQARTLYALTINPSDKLQYFGLPYKDRLKKSHDSIVKLLSELCHYKISYWFNTEVSTPTTNSDNMHLVGSRIHLHGVIRFNDKDALFYFLLEFMTLLCKTSNWDIKPVTDPTAWYEYCKKEPCLNHIYEIDNLFAKDNLEAIKQLFNSNSSLKQQPEEKPRTPHQTGPATIPELQKLSDRKRHKRRK